MRMVDLSPNNRDMLRKAALLLMEGFARNSPRAWKVKGNWKVLVSDPQAQPRARSIRSNRDFPLCRKRL